MRCASYDMLSLLPLTVFAQQVPSPPAVAARAYVLVDYNSGGQLYRNLLEGELRVRR